MAPVSTHPTHPSWGASLSLNYLCSAPQAVSSAPTPQDNAGLRVMKKQPPALKSALPPHVHRWRRQSCSPEGEGVEHSVGQQPASPTSPQPLERDPPRESSTRTIESLQHKRKSKQRKTGPSGGVSEVFCAGSTLEANLHIPRCIYF